MISKAPPFRAGLITSVREGYTIRTARTRGTRAPAARSPRSRNRCPSTSRPARRACRSPRRTHRGTSRPRTCRSMSSTAWASGSRWTGTSRSSSRPGGGGTLGLPSPPRRLLPGRHHAPGAPLTARHPVAVRLLLDVLICAPAGLARRPRRRLLGRELVGAQGAREAAGHSLRHAHGETT